ncbi:MAG: hypothetical protein L6Q51_03390 [Cyclobacteriaceae bacterium]|nr:hypothetical protein [Cyclobacteriaceae bacterium]
MEVANSVAVRIEITGLPLYGIHLTTQKVKQNAAMPAATVVFARLSQATNLFEGALSAVGKNIFTFNKL